MSGKPSTRIVARIIGVVVTALAIALTIYALNRSFLHKPEQATIHQTEPPLIAPGGDFTLLSHTGAKLGLSELRGKLVLIFFGYTFCPDICPVRLNDIDSALGMLGDRASDVQVLFITVDPKRDTPEVLSEYVAHFNQTFIGLTGSDDEIKTVAEKYAIRYILDKPDGDGDYTVGHSSHLALVGADGKLKKTISYQTKTEEIARILEEHLP